jgi:UDP-N-acetylglucosamine 2-epimerase (non-hydrolysing)
MVRKKILLVVGTRPELIKVAPVVKEFERRNLRDQYILINTAQHKDLLEPYWDIFDVRADVNLDVMQEHQNLSELTIRVIDQFQQFISSIREEVGGILAQGDTTTVLGVSMVAFYNQIDFYHLEGGLRSFDLANPFPEEFNRKVASITARIHFCPTEIARQNLLLEGYDSSSIEVVGNTIVDALEEMKIKSKESRDWNNEELKCWIKVDHPLVFITCHRRENQGENLDIILESIKELVLENPSVQFIWITHPNPNVFHPVQDSGISEMKNILVTPPLNYSDIIQLLSHSSLAISDSGGIQEEAPSFGVPVLVLREATERPEGIAAGVAVLVGADKSKLKRGFYQFIERKIPLALNPYGDGKSAGRVVDRIVAEFKKKNF